MADTAIGLGIQFTASANGMTKGLSQVDRQLQNLGKQAAAAGSLFSSFTASSAAAGAAQQQVATDIAFLGSAFKTGQISAQEYASELQAVVGSAQTLSAAFAEGARITAQQATKEEERAATLEKVERLRAIGAISEETYARAAAEASGANEQAAAAEELRAKALARAAQITQANLSPQQEYDAEVQELSEHLAAARISQETYNSAMAKAQTTLDKATQAASDFDDATSAAGDGGTLKFNELTGVLSALPGPIGNVAGRLSGLASAGEGLSKVFGGGAGLSGGLTNIGASVAGLVNPFTVGLAAVAAFGAGATAAARGLLDLEDRVEGLGNLADQLGVSFEFIQVLEEAANRSGVSIETLAGSMTRLQKTLAGADEESKAAQKALDRLGVSVEDLNGLSQQDQIRLIGDRLKAIESPAQRTAAAVALFGKSGAALLPLFKTLGPAADDLERFGKVLNDIDRGRIDGFGDGVDALRVAARGLSTDLILPFTGLGEGIARGAAEFLGGINAIVGPIGDVLQPALAGLGVAFEAFGVVVGGVGRIIGSLIEPIGKLVQSFGAAGDASREAFAELDLSQPVLAAAQFAKEIGNAATAAAEFGAAGFDAALAYQNSLEQIAQLQADGTLTADEAKKMAEQEKAAFDAKIATLDKEAEAQARSAEAAQKAADEKIAAAERAAAAAVDADRKLADAFISAQGLGGGDGATPADTLLAIVRQIEETEAAIVQARAAGDAAAEQAATRRLAVLDQAQAAAEEASQFGFSTQDAERAIDSVRDRLDDTFSFINFELAPEAFSAAQEQLAQLEADLDARIIDPETFEQAADAIRSGFEDALRTAEKIRDLNEQYAQRAAEIDANRIEALSQVSQQPVLATDVRTSEGASEFLRLATGREDPAISEYRKQLSELQKIAREIGKLGGVVDIVGAA
jgi:hypothetical protein